LHNHNLPDNVRQWITNAVGPGASIQATRQLSGATSSTLHHIETMYKGRQHDFVLRRFTKTEWLLDEPDLALHEAEVLKKAADVQIATPELIAYDETGEHCDVPAILMTMVPGMVELYPHDFDKWLYELAAALLPVHALDADTFPWAYFTYGDISAVTVPQWSYQPDLWEKALQIAKQPLPNVPQRFIHRDYHPFNVLWQGSHLSGIVDWVNACRGPAQIDIAHCRSNLFSMYGVEAADKFLAYYQSLVGTSFTYDPFWDVLTIVGFLPDKPSVYPPWLEFGMKNLTDELMLTRFEDQLKSVMARL
jgi:aminoglycoside phosphotransferase (APT) family kinase protein